MKKDGGIDSPFKRGKRKQRHDVQEEKLGKKKGARRQANSGRFWFANRDVRWNGFLIEARTTENKSYSIKKEEFEKITKEAFSTPPGMLPAMQIDLDGLPLWVMRLEDWEFFQAQVGAEHGEHD